MQNGALEITHKQQIAASSYHQNGLLDIEQGVFEFIGSGPVNQAVCPDIHTESIPVRK